ncbi:unnamed protein product [Cuscuta europaea]|uniref:Uncharacterized protein n=1 Tax=Cuscuta europaea TaxID=41803 RepID=A0A9P0ZH61_CUSEU|nr:unnamed protein product [Cuscuta europaea]
MLGSYPTQIIVLVEKDLSPTLSSIHSASTREIRSREKAIKVLELKKPRGEKDPRRKARRRGRVSQSIGVETAGNRHFKGANRSCRPRKPPGFRESRPAFAQQFSSTPPIGLERGLIEGLGKGNYFSTS